MQTEHLFERLKDSCKVVPYDRVPESDREALRTLLRRVRMCSEGPWLSLTERPDVNYSDSDNDSDHDGDHDSDHDSVRDRDRGSDSDSDSDSDKGSEGSQEAPAQQSDDDDESQVCSAQPRAATRVSAQFEHALSDAQGPPVRVLQEHVAQAPASVVAQAPDEESDVEVLLPEAAGPSRKRAAPDPLEGDCARRRASRTRFLLGDSTASRLVCCMIDELVEKETDTPPPSSCGVCLDALCGGCVACVQCNNVCHVGCIVDLVAVTARFTADEKEFSVDAAVRAASDDPDLRRQNCQQCPMCRRGGALMYVRL